MMTNQIGTQLFSTTTVAICKQLHGIPYTVTDSDKLRTFFKRRYPLTQFGHIDWLNTQISIDMDHHAQYITSTIADILEEPFDDTVYLMWNDESVPIIKASLPIIEKNVSCIQMIAGDIFIFNPTQRYVVEILLDSSVMLGIVDNV